MLSYLAILFMGQVLRLIPLRLALALSRLGGAFAFSVLRFRRGVVLSNIRHAFPEKSAAEVHAIAAGTYRNAAMMFLEMLRGMGGNERLEDNVDVEPLPEFRPMKAANKPALFVTPHFGNFDLGAYAFSSAGFPCHVIMKAMHNERVNRLVLETRERRGLRMHVTGESAFGECLEAVRRGEWCAILPDQNAKRRGTEVSFLGRPASFFRGPALLHLATGAPMFLAFAERVDGDPVKHRVRCKRLATPAPTGDEAADVQAITQVAADSIAEEVRRNPSQYFWFHRLWGKVVEAEAVAA